MRSIVKDTLIDLLRILLSSVIGGLASLGMFILRIQRFGTSPESLLNSLFVIGFLSGVIAIIIKTLFENFSKEN